MTVPAARLVTRDELAGYNHSSMTDAALVRGVLAGDPFAFATLMDRHSGVCLRYALRVLGNREDAEDVTQETFVRAYGALDRYDGSVALRTWLMTILVNRCRTALALRGKREARIVIDIDVVMSAAGPVAHSPDALRDSIANAIARLDRAHREAFVLKHVEELSYEEISLVTGVGISALKMRVQRAREKLQSWLEEDRNA